MIFLVHLIQGKKKNTMVCGSEVNSHRSNGAVMVVSSHALMPFFIRESGQFV